MQATSVAGTDTPHGKMPEYTSDAEPSPDSANLIGSAVILMLLTQRLALPAGSFQIPLAVPIVFGFAAWGFLRREFIVDQRRLLAYLATLSLLLVSSIAVSTWGFFSAPSLVYLVGLYSVLVLVAPHCDIEKMFLLHQRAIACFAVIGIGQFAVQLIGMPFIDPLASIPDALMLQGYNTIQPLSYGASIIKSNAMFFLEASHLSKALAMAILIELIYFRRLRFLALFACCYGFTFSGTGIITLAAGILTGLAYIPRKWILTCAAVGVLIAAIVGAAGLADVWVDRTSEFGNTRSSATIRFVTPYTRLWEVLNDDFRLFGRGAGSVEESFTVVGGVEAFDPTPVKLIYEYGPIAAIAFMGYMLYCLYTGLARPPLKHACFVLLFFLTGGLLEAVTLYYCYLMVGAVVSPSRASEPKLSGQLVDTRLGIPDSAHQQRTS